MTADAEVLKLAHEAASKKAILDALGWRNIYNLTTEQRIALDVEYRMAEMEAIEAERKYRRKVDEIAAAKREAQGHE